jgi:hypothetical protein
MIQRSDGASFAREALGELRIGHLDRHITMQARIARAINLAHASFADKREDFVGSEFIADEKRHNAIRSV